MATHNSAEKRARQSVKRNALNRSRRAKVLTVSKEVTAAVVKKDVDGAKTAVRKAEATIARASQKGTIHWKTAARKISRLAKFAKTASGK